MRKGRGQRVTFPNAPLPTHRKRIKWKRLTSPSKSTGCGKKWDHGRGGTRRTHCGATTDSTHWRTEMTRKKQTNKTLQGKVGCRSRGRYGDPLCSCDQRDSPMLLHRPLVVFGPSGVGKGTLLARLFAEFSDTFAFSVSRMSLLSFHYLTETTSSDTTRQPRPGETNGKAYHFVSNEEFRALLADNAFIEHAQFSANFYGTSWQAIHAVRESGRRCVLDIDSQVHLPGTPLHPCSPPSRVSGRSSKQI